MTASSKPEWDEVLVYLPNWEEDGLEPMPSDRAPALPADAAKIDPSDIPF